MVAAIGMRNLNARKGVSERWQSKSLAVKKALEARQEDSNTSTAATPTSKDPYGPCPVCQDYLNPELDTACALCDGCKQYVHHKCGNIGKVQLYLTCKEHTTDVSEIHVIMLVVSNIQCRSHQIHNPRWMLTGIYPHLLMNN